MAYTKRIIIGLLGLAIILRLPAILLQPNYSFFQRWDDGGNLSTSTKESDTVTNVDVANDEDHIISSDNDAINSPSANDVITSHPSRHETATLQNTTIAEKWEVSIMITSNLIPTHPNIDMLKDTIYSLHKYLIGLPLDVPIYVVVDGLPEKKNTTENQNREELYIQAVQNGDFAPLSNVMVAPMRVHRNLAGSVKYTLENYIQTEFLYIIQHDLPFYNRIPHTNLIQTMREHPDVLFNVRFRYNNKKHTRGSHCYSYHNMSDFPAEDFNGLNFFSVTAWSDNNHLTTKKYYTFLLSNMKHHRRAMETVLGWKARYNCTYLGQQIYGRRDDGQTHICHLNGRVSQSYNDANKDNMTGWEKKAIWCRNEVYRELNSTSEQMNDDDSVK